MKENWKQCFARILDHEGGWSDVKADRGGPTMKGVTYNEFCAFKGYPQCKDKKWDPKIVKQLRNMSSADIEAYYRTRKWDPMHGDVLPPGIDMACADSATLFGVRQATLFLQRAIGRPDTGTLTLDDIEAAKRESRADVVGNICSQRHALAEHLVEKDPEQKIFLEGWMNRTTELQQESYQLIVASAQVRLRELGYPVGSPDGVPGAMTHTSILSFQSFNSLPLTGSLDHETIVALEDDQAAEFPISDSRKTITAEELIERGSRDVAEARTNKNLARGGAVLSLAGGIDQTFDFGVLDGIMGGVGKVRGYIADAGLGSVISQRIVLCAILFGLASYVWHRADVKEWRRVLKARLGHDLSR